MRYLHTMLRVRNLDAALDFYCNKLGLKEVQRRVDEKNRYTLVFLAAPDDSARLQEARATSGRAAPLVELTFNWDAEDYGEARFFGHLAYESTTSIKPAIASTRPASLSIGHPAMERWPLCDLRTITQSSYSSAVKPCRRESHGYRCPIPGDGSGLQRTLFGGTRAAMHLPHSAKGSIPAVVRPSSSGLGHRPFTAETRVRFP